MAAGLNRLTVRQVATLSKPGRYSDGGGLYLKVRPGGSKQWVFLRVEQKDGRRKQTEIGLGGAGPTGISLATARQKAQECRQLKAAGGNILVRKRVMQAAEKAKSITFGQFADEYVRLQKPAWTNPKHAAQWEMTLGPAYCKSIRSMPIAEVTVEDVLGILVPIWQSKPETARRIRMRIERVMDAARVKGLVSAENPARWKGHLDHLLPKRSKASKTHHAAMPFGDVPQFMVELSALGSVAAAALRLLILTATRTSEVLNARWQEFDLKSKVWTIPRERMKSRRSHRIPLSDAAMAVLHAMNGRSREWVFPAPGRDLPLSNMALLMQLRRMGRRDVTTHGFRSTFRDWAAETTSFPREVAEMALAHTIESDTEAAYRRGDLLEKRVSMMASWGQYCSSAADTPAEHQSA